MPARIPVSLNVIRVDKPCSASWDKMRGDERVRFCEECSLHVYNLSAMTRKAAEQLVASREGRLCVRYYQRADGTVITRDCGGGLRRAMKRARMLTATVAGFLFAAALAPFGIGWASKPQPQTGSSAPCVMGESNAIMGDVVTPNAPVMGKVVSVTGMLPPLSPSTQPTTAPTTAPATQPSPLLKMIIPARASGSYNSSPAR